MLSPSITSENAEAKPAFSPMDMKRMRAKTLQSELPFRVACWLMQTFAKVGQRDSHSPSKTHHVRLIAISVSNYVEKARWGLDLLEDDETSSIYYTEDCHPPGGCAYYTVQASNDRASQSPMIVDDDSTNVVWGSDAILQHLFIDKNNSTTVDLYPNDIRDKIIEFEKDLGLRLGASARCLAYHALLDPSQRHYSAATKVFCQSSPWIERWLYIFLLYTGMIPSIMSKLLKIDDSDVITNSEQNVRQAFAQLSERLERVKKTSGNEKESDHVYLMDTPTRRYGFTAADLAFCSLVYFLIRPPELAPLHIPAKDMPPRLLDLSQELSVTTAGQHIRYVYQKHRPIDKAKGYVVLKCVNQNRIPWKELASTVGYGLAFAVGCFFLF